MNSSPQPARSGVSYNTRKRYNLQKKKGAYIKESRSTGSPGRATLRQRGVLSIAPALPILTPGYKKHEN